MKAQSRDAASFPLLARLRGHNAIHTTEAVAALVIIDGTSMVYPLKTSLGEAP